MRVIFKTFVFLFAIVLVTAACAVPFSPRVVRGSGDIVEEVRDVSDFDEILISGAGSVIITQGDRESLTIETDANLLKYIETEVKGGTLEIGFTKGVVFSSSGGGNALQPTDGITFRISVIDLKAVSVSGAADIEMGKLKADAFRIDLSGAGDIFVDDLNASRFTVVVSGAGDVQISGKTDTQEIRLSGLGRYQGFNLESRTASVTISGAGGAEVWVGEVLDVVISGAGDVKYYGSPTVNPDISGLGRIQSQGEK